eukprot:scaffold238229_cov19-Tisochrysis_lutea.AAC.1
MGRQLRSHLVEKRKDTCCHASYALLARADLAPSSSPTSWLPPDPWLTIYQPLNTPVLAAQNSCPRPYCRPCKVEIWHVYSRSADNAPCHILHMHARAHTHMYMHTRMHACKQPSASPSIHPFIHPFIHASCM